MTRIALLGATGFIAAEFARQIRQRGHHAIAIDSASYHSLNPDLLAQSIREAAPDCVINCAGYTGKPNVDACEQNKAACLAANAVLPGVVAEACDQLNLTWGHLSSGCIYTGSPEGRLGYRETDPPNFTFRQNNCSFYAGSKALGEEILAATDNCFIWRLRLPFSNIDSPRNYLTKLIHYDRLLEADNSLSELTECVAACLDCFDNGVATGIYHLTNPGHVRASDVVELIHESGLTHKKFEFFESEAEFMDKAAITPRSNCILDSTKALNAGLKLTEVHDAIRTALANWQA